MIICCLYLWILRVFNSCQFSQHIHCLSSYSFTFSFLLYLYLLVILCLILFFFYEPPNSLIKFLHYECEKKKQAQLIFFIAFENLVFWHPFNNLSLLPAWVEKELRHDRLLAPHYRYYVREMRILAYTQLLESYRSLTLQYMATAFGVSTEFIDR